MANYVKFTLEDGTFVYIESNEVPRGSSGLIPPRGAGEAAEQAGHSFDEAVEGARKMAGAMIQKFHDGSSEPPSEVAISFGLKASSDLGVLVIARSGVEANYNVSLRWHKEKPEAEKEDSQDEKKEE